MSEEVHRVFFLAWISKMASMQTEFIYMPSDKVTFQTVVGEYKSRGVPGCVGSVDGVHIAWDCCPSYTILEHVQRQGGFCIRCIQSYL